MWSTIQGFGANLLPDIGIKLMDSLPPAMTISALPERIFSAAMAMACKPDEQKRLMVAAGTVSGKPARNVATRAIFMPASPSGIAQPKITSSISALFTSGWRFNKSLNTAAAMSSGRVFFSVPRPDLPTAVRKQSMMTASCILVPQRLSGFQHELHALLRLRISAQAQKRFALQVEQILLADGLFAGQPASADDIGELFRHHHVVVGNVTALAHAPRSDLQHGKCVFAAHFHVRARRTGLIILHQRQPQRFGVVDHAVRIH